VTVVGRHRRACHFEPPTDNKMVRRRHEVAAIARQGDPQGEVRSTE
jgi:hypothetical protein